MQGVSDKCHLFSNTCKKEKQKSSKEHASQIVAIGRSRACKAIPGLLSSRAAVLKSTRPPGSRRPRRIAERAHRCWNRLQAPETMAQEQRPASAPEKDKPQIKLFFSNTYRNKRNKPLVFIHLKIERNRTRLFSYTCMPPPGGGRDSSELAHLHRQLLKIARSQTARSGHPQIGDENPLRAE